MERMFQFLLYHSVFCMKPVYTHTHANAHGGATLAELLELPWLRVITLNWKGESAIVFHPFLLRDKDSLASKKVKID